MIIILIFEVTLAMSHHRNQNFRGPGRGVFIKIISKLTLELFLIEESDIYQMLFGPTEKY